MSLLCARSAAKDIVWVTVKVINSLIVLRTETKDAFGIELLAYYDKNKLKRPITMAKITYAEGGLLTYLLEVSVFQTGDSLGL